VEKNSKNYRQLCEACGHGNTAQSGDYGVGLGRRQNNIAGKLDSMLTLGHLFYAVLTIDTARLL